MAGIDYTEMASVAQELIDDNGRDVTIIRFGQTPADSNKPWKGNTTPRATPDATDTVKGCFVPLAGSGLGIDTIDSDILKRTEEVCLVGPGATFDLRTADEVQDGSVYKKVTFVQMLKPADTVLMYYIGVER
jgi:hypothetical protein